MKQLFFKSRNVVNEDNRKRIKKIEKTEKKNQVRKNEVDAEGLSSTYPYCFTDELKLRLKPE